MAEPDRFRDAATIRVQAPVERVRRLLSNPNVLSRMDDRIQGHDVDVFREEDEVEVWAEDGRLHLAFRLLEEEGSTRVAAREDVEPGGLLETTKRWLFPGRAHEDLEDELARFRELAEEPELPPSL